MVQHCTKHVPCLRKVWCVSGRGQRDSDRTTGAAAVADFQPFVDAGVTTFDTAGALAVEDVLWSAATLLQEPPLQLMQHVLEAITSQRSNFPVVKGDTLQLHACLFEVSPQA